MPARNFQPIGAKQPDWESGSGPLSLPSGISAEIEGTQYLAGLVIREETNLMSGATDGEAIYQQMKYRKLKGFWGLLNVSKLF